MTRFGVWSVTCTKVLRSDVASADYYRGIAPRLPRSSSDSLSHTALFLVQRLHIRHRLSKLFHKFSYDRAARLHTID